MEEKDYSELISSNSMLLTFECWIKYIEGFTRGIQSSKQVDTQVVLDCIGEVLEGMQKIKTQTIDLLIHCEEILKEDNEIKYLEVQNDV